MNLVKRAGLYTIRQKQKSLLLFLVLVLVSTLVLTGIAIGSAVSDTFTDMHGDIAGRLTLERGEPERDHDALLRAFEYGGIEAINRLQVEQLNSGFFVTFDTLEAIMAVDGVRNYNVTAELQWKDVVPKNFDFLTDNDVTLVNMYGEGVPTRLANMWSATNSELMEGFINGNLRLESGRHITANDHRTVMISEELAEYNNLDIGDTLMISGNPVARGIEVSSVTLEFEVVGIFSGTRAQEMYETTGGNLMVDNLALNSDTFIIDMATLMEEYKRSNYFGTGAVGSLPGLLSIIIENPNDIDRVHDQIANLPEVYGKNFTIIMGTEGFEGVLSSLSSLRGLVQTLIVIIVLVSMTILAIILTIWTRGRVKEIGIYLACGIKKREILTQFALEAILIAAVAFMLSLPISQMTAHGAGDYIISQFVTAQQLRNEQLEGSEAVNVAQGGIIIVQPDSGFMNTANIENTLNLVDVTVVGRDLLLVYVIGLPLVIGAVLIASYTVVKLKPREILSKMS